MKLYKLPAAINMNGLVAVTTNTLSLQIYCNSWNTFTWQPISIGTAFYTSATTDDVEWYFLVTGGAVEFVVTTVPTIDLKSGIEKVLPVTLSLENSYALFRLSGYHQNTGILNYVLTNASVMATPNSIPSISVTQKIPRKF
jgi:hypothetical protein